MWDEIDVENEFSFSCLLKIRLYMQDCFAHLKLYHYTLYTTLIGGKYVNKRYLKDYAKDYQKNRDKSHVRPTIPVIISRHSGYDIK